MSYLLDIFNKRQPMAMPSGGPNTGAPVNSSNWGSRNPAGTPDWAQATGTPIPFLNGGGAQGESALQPAQFRHQAQAAGIQPPSMMSQLNAQNSPPPGLAGMFPGGATPPPMGAGPGWASMTENMGGAGMTLPSGGPNVQQTKPPALDGLVGISGPSSIDEAIAIACGIPPSQINRGPGGNAQNNPTPQMGGGLNQVQLGGGMPPLIPNAVDQGLGMQQMNFGNQMGGMNNWFSNFAAPRPMPAPAPAAPASMMPMKGMFGVR